jgi:hypothetical protein
MSPAVVRDGIISRFATGTGLLAVGEAAEGRGVARRLAGGERIFFFT